MKKIRIGFTDFWPGYVPEYSSIVKILKKHFDVEIIDTKNKNAKNQVEYLFFSCLSQDFLDYSCIRIFYTGENIIPDFNLCDYAIGFEKMTLGDRYFRDPLWYEYIRGNKRLLPGNYERFNPADDIKNKRFCAMVVSNGRNADLFREKFFYKLSEYKKVDSGGRYLNNIGISEGVKDKLSFIHNYKFSLAIENVSHEGYCTEKLIESFAAGTVPIYWGAPDIAEYFNPKAFINCHDFTSFEEIIERIKDIDNDDEKYCMMLKEPVFSNEYYSPKQQDNRFEKWLVSIFKREYQIRRNQAGAMKGYENRCRKQRDCSKCVL